MERADGGASSGRGVERPLARIEQGLLDEHLMSCIPRS